MIHVSNVLTTGTGGQKEAGVPRSTELLVTRYQTQHSNAAESAPLPCWTLNHFKNRP